MIQKKLKENKNFSRLLAILIALACLSVLIISLSVGKSQNPAWPLFLELDAPNSFYVQNNEGPDKGTKAVVDSNGQRVSLINSSNNVYSQMFFSAEHNILSLVQRVYIYENNLYVLGYKTDSSLSEIESLKLVKYSLNGDFLEEIYTYDRFDENYYFVFDMTIRNNTIFLSMSQYNKLVILTINLDDTSDKHMYTYQLASELFTTVWDYAKNELVVIDSFNQAYIINPSVITAESTLPIVSKNYRIESPDPNYDIEFCVDEYIDHQIRLTNKQKTDSFNVLPGSISWDLINSSVYLCDSTSNCVIDYDFNSYEYDCFSSFNYEPGILLLTIAYWFSIAYLVLLALLSIVCWLIYLSKKEKERSLKIFIGLAIFLAVALTLIFVFMKFFDWQKSTNESELDSVCEIVSSSTKVNVDEFNYETMTYNGKYDKEFVDNTHNECRKIVALLEKVCATTNSFTNLNYNYEIFGYDFNNSQFQCLSHMNSYIETYGKNTLEENSNDLFDGNLIKGQSNSEMFQTNYTIAPLYNINNKIVGAIAISISDISMILTANILYVEVVIAAALALVIIFIISKQWNIFMVSIKKYHHARKKKIPHAEVFFSGTMEFFRNYFATLDNVLCVLISKDMLASTPYASNGVLIGFPIMLFGVGCLISSLIFPKISRKSNIKKVYLIASFCVCLIMIFSAYTVFVNSFSLYCVSKVLFGIFQGIIFISNQTLPMCVTDEKVRFDAVRSISLTDVSAPIISVVVSAFISREFGNYMIYIIGFVFSAFIFIMAIIFMPRHDKFKTRAKTYLGKTSWKQIIKYFWDPAILCCALISIVSMCVGAYKSYLFPLYSEGLSLSDLEISNYFVIASALVFIFSPALDTLTKRFDHWNNVVSYLVVLSAIFGVFYINTTLIWAFAAFFLSAIVQKSLNAEYNLLWPRKCKQMFIDPALIQPIFSGIGSLGLTVRSLVLGLFLGLGEGYACVALGCLCLVTGILFYFSSRKSVIRYPNN